MGEKLKQSQFTFEKFAKNKIASKSIKNYGAIIIVRNSKEIIDIVDRIAPEHLEIKVNNPEAIEKEFQMQVLYFRKIWPRGYRRLYCWT